MKFDDCACGGQTLGKLLQPAVMGLLWREPLHGYLIVQRLGKMKMMHGREPDPSGIYRLLKSMEKDGLVQSTWDAGQAGPNKRRFQLTADGQACLKCWVATLDDYRGAIDDLLATIREGTHARKSHRAAARKVEESAPVALGIMRAKRVTDPPRRLARKPQASG